MKNEIDKIQVKNLIGVSRKDEMKPPNFIFSRFPKGNE